MMLTPGGKEAEDAIKRRIRKLKKLEVKIRFGQAGFAGDPCLICASGLVWDQYFNLDANPRKQARYSLESLVRMDSDALQDVIAAYVLLVYDRFYRENGIMNASIYDPQVLVYLGLPGHADAQAIKRRFRQLAMQYHPDTGGDPERFIALLEQYRKLKLD